MLLLSEKLGTLYKIKMTRKKERDSKDHGPNLYLRKSHNSFLQNNNTILLFNSFSFGIYLRYFLQHSMPCVLTFFF